MRFFLAFAIALAGFASTAEAATLSCRESNGDPVYVTFSGNNAQVNLAMKADSKVLTYTGRGVLNPSYAYYQVYGQSLQVSESIFQTGKGTMYYHWETRRARSRWQDDDDRRRHRRKEERRRSRRDDDDDRRHRTQRHVVTIHC